MSKAYCETCDDLVEAKIEKVIFQEEVDDKIITYDGYECKCSICNSEVTVEEYDDINIDNYKKALIKENNIISKEEIEEIIDKYNIGKKPLAMLLGWGEATIIRYIDKGHVPSKKYSERLRILINPNEMRRTLIDNKENITQVAFNKCMNAINKLVGDEEALDIEYNNKIEEVANYILSKNYEITPLSLQKILYYIQAFRISMFNEWIFKDECSAWAHGPVYENIYHKYKIYKYNRIDRYKGEIDLSKEEKIFIDSILSAFGHYTGKTLELFTHNEIPWNKARVGIGDNEVSNINIKKDDIKNYFNSVCDKFSILNLIDIKNYSNYLMENIL